jgi:hypothetical protein
MPPPARSERPFTFSESEGFVLALAFALVLALGYARPSRRCPPFLASQREGASARGVGAGAYLAVWPTQRRSGAAGGAEERRPSGGMSAGAYLGGVASGVVFRRLAIPLRPSAPVPTRQAVARSDEARSDDERGHSAAPVCARRRSHDATGSAASGRRAAKARESA